MSELFNKTTLFFKANSNRDFIDSQRILHGRGRCYEGFEFLNVDFFQPVLLLTCYKEFPKGLLKEYLIFLRRFQSENFSCVVIQNRYLANSPSAVLWGELPDNVYARRGNLNFNLHLNAQQNSGFFLDMEVGRQWIEKNAPEKNVLNLFAYTCAFSVVAIAANAKRVVNVDMSSSALNTGRTNHILNNLPKEKSEFLAENILKSWGRIKRRGPYDVVIVDPPSYQKGSFIAEKDYVKVIRRLPELLPGGGLALICLNAPELSETYLRNVIEENIHAAEFVERIMQSDAFPDVNTEQQLKLLVYKIPAMLQGEV